MKVEIGDRLVWKGDRRVVWQVVTIGKSSTGIYLYPAPSPGYTDSSFVGKVLCMWDPTDDKVWEHEDSFATWVKEVRDEYLEIQAS